MPTVGGTKNLDVDAIVALAPDLVVVNDEENRIEDADALAARGLAVHSMSPRSVADVGPGGRARSRPRSVSSAPAPFDDVGRVAGAHARARRARPRSSRSGGGRGCRSRPTPTARRCSTHVGVAQRLRRRGRAVSRGRRSPRSRRARRTSSSCRASRTRSPTAHAREVARGGAGRAHDRSSTAATSSGGGSARRRRGACSACADGRADGAGARADRRPASGATCPRCRSRPARPARTRSRSCCARSRRRGRRSGPRSRRSCRWSRRAPGRGGC